MGGGGINVATIATLATDATIKEMTMYINTEYDFALKKIKQISS